MSVSVFIVNLHRIESTNAIPKPLIPFECNEIRKNYSPDLSIFVNLRADAIEMCACDDARLVNSLNAVDAPNMLWLRYERVGI